ncbi:hypothetical protein BpHYR1_021605 [Brachionus plicatilis]|uniref:Uncharacterized protein n=1 Tax=Brachionus plicatilis TaxID=10195 RepID=A0A3M7T894_BRAPC|nr:hypothetical protein BpHYR1_021605 [Brachionus plicatilis]
MNSDFKKSNVQFIRHACQYIPIITLFLHSVYYLNIFGILMFSLFLYYLILLLFGFGFGPRVPINRFVQKRAKKKKLQNQSLKSQTMK